MAEKSKKPKRGKLVPKIKKRYAAEIMIHEPDAWRAFSEGCLRNRYFHERVFKRGPKCLGCNRRFNHEEAKISSKIEKHHESYIRLCIGAALPPNSDDIDRQAADKEFNQVPDCRRCQAENPVYFQGCLKLIFPLHSSCHGRVHEKEKYFLKAWRKKLFDDFNQATK